MDTKKKKKKFKDMMGPPYIKEPMGPPKSLKKYSYGYTDNLPRYGYLGRNNPKGLESKRPDPYEGMTEEPPHRGGGEYDWAKEARGIDLSKEMKDFKKENRAMKKGKSLTDVLLEKDKKKKRKAKRAMKRSLIPAEPSNTPYRVPQG
jgi:hypothetical protein